MLILGLDPGTRRANPTGWALLATGTDRVIRYGLLKPTGADHLASLGRCFEGLLGQLLRDRAWAPELVAIEEPYVGVNAQSALCLAQLVGAYKVITAQHGVPVRGVNPTQAKAALATGNASKAAIQQAVQLRYGLTVADHIADAIAIALAATTAPAHPARRRAVGRR